MGGEVAPGWKRFGHSFYEALLPSERVIGMRPEANPKARREFWLHSC